MPWPAPTLAGPVNGSTSVTSFVLTDKPTVALDDKPKGAPHG